MVFLMADTGGTAARDGGGGRLKLHVILKGSSPRRPQSQPAKARAPRSPATLIPAAIAIWSPAKMRLFAPYLGVAGSGALIAAASWQAMLQGPPGG